MAMMKMILLQKSKTMKTKLLLKLKNGGIRLTNSSKNTIFDKEITVGKAVISERYSRNLLTFILSF